MAARSILNKLEPKIESISDRVLGLEQSLDGTDRRVEDVYQVQESIQDRLDVAEEEVTSLKAQNIDLTKHLNTVIKELNNMKAWLKRHYDQNIDVDNNIAVADLYCHEEFDFAQISDEE